MVAATIGKQLLQLRDHVDRLATLTDRETGRALSARARRLLRPPRIAVVGEFSAGKSTLINLLLGNYVLPTSVVPTTAVPTLLRHANRPQARLVIKEGKSTPVSFERLSSVVRTGEALAGLRRIDIALPAARLRKVEILDTPGLSDPELDAELVFDALRRVDSCIWCTLATQAWRHTEQASWKRIDASVKRRSILAITHADALNTVAERKKVYARVRSAAKNDFAAVLMMSLSQAIAARSGTAASAREQWKNSGYPALETALDRVVDASAVLKSRRLLERLLDALGEVEVPPGPPGTKAGPEAVADAWATTASALNANVSPDRWAEDAAAHIARFRTRYLPPDTALAGLFSCDAEVLRTSAREDETPGERMAAVVAQLGAELAEGVEELACEATDEAPAEGLARAHAHATELARAALRALNSQTRTTNAAAV